VLISTFGMRLRWRIALAVLILLGACAAVLAIVIRRAGPILKGRITETLSARFQSRVQLGDLDVFALRGLEVSGGHLAIYAPGVNEPLISVDHFSFHSGILGLFERPMHVGTVQVSGLKINIPPKEVRHELPGDGRPYFGKIKIAVDTIVCRSSELVIGTSRPDKDPKRFELKNIELHDVGPNKPWRYAATLINAIPRGEIRAAGTFGPWRTESPGDSPVTGHYTFAHADLNTIRGIRGILSSTGDFQGQLDRIVVDGTTETPDFSLDTANHPMPLRTRFHAIVDGLTADTYLDPVNATLRNSSFTTKGAVINIKGKGHRIELDVDIPQGRVQDFLDLAVNTRPAVLTGDIGILARLTIPPGKERVADKLRVRGRFTLSRIHFTNPQVQDKVDMLSLRARGEPKLAKPGAEDVTSRMKAAFSLDRAAMEIHDLQYELPGAEVSLNGNYSLDGQQFDFHGKIDTEASLSQMVESKPLSLVLKVAPLFRRKGGGAEIPVSITGTKSEPKFGIDVFKRHQPREERMQVPR
jgi:hypothetical protein